MQKEIRIKESKKYFFISVVNLVSKAKEVIGSAKEFFGERKKINNEAKKVTALRRNIPFYFFAITSLFNISISKMSVEKGGIK